MGRIKSICVYCGSGPGTNPHFIEAARRFGQILATNRIRLVYGGGSIGLMGAVASAVREHGGEITGIIPQFLVEREHAFRDSQELIVTRDMHERKQTMFERSDAFVALPGGIGTLEEVVEMMTWAQLGRHEKPILLANIDGFWEPFRTLLAHMEKLQFIRAGLTIHPLIADDVEDILPELIEASAEAPADKDMKTAAAGRM